LMLATSIWLPENIDPPELMKSIMMKAKSAKPTAMATRTPPLLRIFSKVAIRNTDLLFCVFIQATNIQKIVLPHLKQLFDCVYN
jgi:hypothetical protein